VGGHGRNDSIEFFPFKTDREEAENDVKKLNLEMTFNLEFVPFVSNKNHSPSRLEINFSVNFSLVSKLWLFLRIFF